MMIDARRTRYHRYMSHAATTCSLPSTPTNAATPTLCTAVNGMYPSGCVATFSCLPGYLLSGASTPTSTTSTCSGLPAAWSPDPSTVQCNCKLIFWSVHRIEAQRGTVTWATMCSMMCLSLHTTFYEYRRLQARNLSELNEIWEFFDMCTLNSKDRRKLAIWMQPRILLVRRNTLSVDLFIAKGSTQLRLCK